MNNEQLRQMYLNQRDGLNAVEFYRAFVKWLDYRPEHFNSEKTLQQLKREFVRAINQD